MKLCPYPFSRMQTKNDKEGGFFPCCPSWFNQSYWDYGAEKNLDNLWNGAQAQELRKRIYEGDYSFCNRNECKIPLLTVEELSNPDINFIETPISKENLEAIKQKNPIMPEQPSSLHLAADLRCNLKCPTCRPEIISNVVESVEADQEYELVHKLKDNVEIIKMSSSGEVFYSQAQRKLLKSFNKEDFPKLRRVHIVSNGTLFNQKAYNDLLPGSSYIKDVSISIDAGSKETYEKLRGPYWEQVVSNIEWLGKMRKAGKFELFTLNCTLIRDNYRDIPQLVELGRKNHVDRILIQKYNFAENQGYRTIKDQEAQAIHLPTHPEHIHMIRTLEMFKNDPLVHTLLDLEGFESKIENKIKRRKAVIEMGNLASMIDDNQFVEALILINDLFEADSIDPDELKFIKSRIEGNITNWDFKKLNLKKYLTADSAWIQSSAIAVMMSSVYHLHERGNYLKAIKVFIVISYFTNEFSSDFLATLSSCFKNLSRLDEADIFREKSLVKKLQEIENSPRLEQTEDLYSLNMQLAYLLKQQSNYPTLITYLKEAIKHEPAAEAGKASELLYYAYCDRGFYFKEQENHSEAIDCFKEAIKIEPEEKKGVAAEQLYYLHRDIGFSLQKAAKYFQASSILTESLSYGLSDEFLYFSLGVSLKRQKKYAEAKESFNKGLKINPVHYYSLMELGCIEILEDRREQAVELFLKAQKVEPEEKKAYGRKMMMVAQRKKKS